MGNSILENPKINIILDERTGNDRQRLLKEFYEQGIDDFEFWEATVLTHSVVESINASHKKIVQWAKDNNLPEVIIGEQDLTFTCPTAWWYFLNNKPQQYALYLWGSYILPLSNRMVCGFQLYIISERFYDKFLSVPSNVHIDTAMDILEGDIHFCYPFPALQRAGFSANNKEQVDYNVILKEEDIYRG